MKRPSSGTSPLAGRPFSRVPETSLVGTNPPYPPLTGGVITDRRARFCEPMCFSRQWPPTGRTVVAHFRLPPCQGGVGGVGFPVGRGVPFILLIESVHRHSGESRNPFSPMSLAFRPDVLVPGWGRCGRRHICPPHPFRTRTRRLSRELESNAKTKVKTHKMDSGFRRYDVQTALPLAGGQVATCPYPKGAIAPFSISINP